MPLTDDPWLPTPDDDGNIPAVRACASVEVFRFDGTSSLTLLPNVECLWIDFREGTDPGRAGFRYNLASGLEGAPTTFEQALGTGSTGGLIIETGDRLVVRATQPDGETVECLFDGFAVDFGMQLDADSEQVPIGALGVAWRCWDDPIKGALIRDASTPSTVADVETDLVAHFNPDGEKNCIPDGAMAGAIAGGVDRKYPTFLDPLVIRSPDVRTNWTLPKAVRYLLFRENPDEDFVENPDGADLDELLTGREPIDGTAYDPADSSTFTNADIVVPDTPVTGKDWPGTVNRLVAEVGFGTHFELSTEDGLPKTRFQIFQQQAGDTKHLYLASRGSPFSPTTFNFNSSSLHRDVSEVVNRWMVKGALERFEVSLLLVAGYQCSTTDNTPANLKTFNSGDPGYIAAKRNSYRLYVFDETGEGHYNVPSTSTSHDHDPTSLDAVLGAPGVGGQPKYARRRRKPLGKLISQDSTGKPFSARLAIATGLTIAPGVWAGGSSEIWQEITSTTWRLLPDRLGIEITDTNPNSWDIGKSTLTGAPYPAGIVHGVEAMCGATGSVPFLLRLTCVFEGDKAVASIAERGDGSPLPQAITRFIDASDRYRKETVYFPSAFNKGSGGASVVKRDDTDLAKAEASSIKLATEAGVLDGTIGIPRLTTYYKIGDRIASIDGRGLSLDTGSVDTPPVYPVVVGRRFEFSESGQITTLELSDAGTDRARYARKAKRRVYHV